jgi:hypothetical protein
VLSLPAESTSDDDDAALLLAPVQVWEDSHLLLETVGSSGLLLDLLRKETLVVRERHGLFTCPLTERAGMGI